jgi:4-hydroxy-2-oxoglutarate aldolase
LCIEEAVRTREFAGAAELQDRANPAAGAIASYGIPGLKYAMDWQGYYGGIPRLPLTPPGPASPTHRRGFSRDPQLMVVV